MTPLTRTGPCSVNSRKSVVAAMAGDIPLATVFKGSFYYIPSYIISILLLLLFPYGTVLVLSNMVK